MTLEIGMKKERRGFQIEHNLPSLTKLLDVSMANKLQVHFRKLPAEMRSDF